MGWEEALNESERCGNYCGLEKDNILKLRLLCEELMSLMKSVLGDFSGEFWIEHKNDNTYKVYVDANVSVNFMQREKLMESEKSSSSRQKNLVSMIKGIWKDYVEIQSIVSVDTSIRQPFNIMGMDVMTSDMVLGGWSFNDYIQNSKANEEDEDLKDIEQFIVKGIADDIVVSARKDHARLVAVKKF
jgi:hypothetical protein